MRDNPQITRDNFVDSLRVMVPSFKIDPLWLEDEPLHYPIINDLARFVCDQMRSGNVDRARSGIDFLEHLLESANSHLRDLVHECLETLNSSPQINELKTYFGERVRELWNSSFQAP